MRALALVTALMAGPASAAELAPLWTLSGFADPESVALSADGKSLYVTNVAGEGDARDGVGFVSRVSLDGRMLQREWVTGLNGPKGAIVRGGRLYVADIDAIAEIDTASGKVVARHAAAGAKFLNDAAIAPDGSVLSSDSQNARIYGLKDGAVTTWAEDKALAAINGLYPEAGRLVISTMAGKLLALDWTTKAITVLADGLGDADGIADAGQGAYFVSEWPGLIHRVAADGSRETLIDRKKDEVYANDILRIGDTLLIPNWKPGRLEAYKIGG